MSDQIRGKTALITGSTSGIGLGIAKSLAQAGVNIVLNGLIQPENIQKLMDELTTSYQVKVYYHGANLMEASEVHRMIHESADVMGSLDILVNNAGIQRVHAIADFPDEDWQAIINLNLSATFYAIKSALPYMRKGGFGRIINTASVHGLVGSVQKSAYVAAKHGVIGLTKVIALETAEENITCNAICPGWTRTELIEPQIKAKGEKMGAKSEQEAVRALLQEKQPSCNFVQTSDIGALTLFLCSSAAAQMTGVSLPIDGGWTAQ